VQNIFLTGGESTYALDRFRLDGGNSEVGCLFWLAINLVSFANDIKLWEERGYGFHFILGLHSWV